MDLQQIRQTLNSPAGLELKKYLQTRLNELRSIERVQEKDAPTHQAIEIKSARRAYFKLKEIMQDLGDFSEESKTRDPADSYDVV